MQRVAVIGCGWLGLPLGIELVKRGYEVHGTTTKSDKLPTLEEQSISGYVLQLPEINKDVLGSSLFSCDVYIINIPPGRRNPTNALKYPERISALLNAISRRTVNPRVIFTSSTGVYKNTGATAVESSPTVAEKDSVVLQVENLIRKSIKNYVILRLAGLVGPGRHPGSWFADRSNVEGGGTPINMVHQEDCVSIISDVVEDRDVEGVYNVCSDRHPVKRNFYKEMSNLKGTKSPSWKEGVVPFKIVDNQKLKKRLGINYKFSDPMLFSNF